MSSLKHNINFPNSALNHEFRDALHVNGYHAYPSRSRTPLGFSTPTNPNNLAPAVESEPGADEDPKLSVFKELYARNEARISTLLTEHGGALPASSAGLGDRTMQEDGELEVEDHPQIVLPLKKATRAIDEDDYDESDAEDEENAGHFSPLKLKSAVSSIAPIASSHSLLRRISSSSLPASVKGGTILGLAKASEDVRKRLEDDKKAAEDAAKRSFHTLFYSLENDRDAMLDQEKLDESERQVDVEMNGGTGGGSHANSSSSNAQHGTLSQTNLGASSLTLKHLIARIDAKRDQVQASDAELRSLMSEVRKNRSKWASAEKIGQEELYEAAEKVLSELKAMTEHSSAFLTRVNKREAPDYYNGDQSRYI